MELWAHRGCGKGPLENTLEGFQQALRAGFSAMEFDVMLSADGTPWVHHDWVMGRCAKPIDIQAWRSPETVSFHQLNALGLKCFSVSGHAIPSLAEVVEFFIQHDIRANVELKALNPQDAVRLGRAVLKVLADWPVAVRQHIQQHWVFSSFYHASLLPLYASGYALALLFEALPQRWVLHADALQAQAVHVHHAVVDASVVRRVHTTGREIRAYTVNSLQRVHELQLLGVDGVFTDNMNLSVFERG